MGQKWSSLGVGILMKEAMSPDPQVCRTASPQRGVSETGDEAPPASAWSRTVSAKK